MFWGFAVSLKNRSNDAGCCFAFLPVILNNVLMFSDRKVMSVHTLYIVCVLGGTVCMNGYINTVI